MSLDVTRFEQAEYVNQQWALTVPMHTELEEVLKPDFLANVATKLRPYDRIQVRIDTGEWYAEILVIDCGRNWVKAIVLLKLDLVEHQIEATNLQDTKEYYVQFRGPHLKFCVIRKSDSESVKEHCATKSEAHAWLNDYLQALLVR